jgi:hypothetical protein
MVADEGTDQYICWSPSGTSFLVPNQDEFSKEVLPRFFKHNNFTSFIRQLNMYGFHKIPSVQQGSLLSGQQPEILEFANEYFIRDRPELLVNVVRRKNVQQDEQQKVESQDFTSISIELSQIKRQQLSISTEIAKMQRENQAIWQQSLQLQQQYDKQKDTIQKILSFLASVFHTNKKLGSAKKRKLLLDEQESELGGYHFDIDENQILNLFADDADQKNDNFLPILEPTQDVGSESLVIANKPFPIPSKLETLNELPFDPNFQALTTQVHDLSEDIDLLQDRIYDLGTMVGVDDLNDLNWGSTSHPSNGEALMELITTAEDDQKPSEEELKHKGKDDDFDFDEFFNQ